MNSQEESDLRDELALTKKKVEKLESEKLFQGDEIRALKVEVRSYQEELRSLNGKVHSLESQAIQEAPFKTIGQEVRLRYLENHRRRIGRKIGNLGTERIKCGDRAAHRGRPVVDALLCLTGVITDREVYRDLYGVDAEIVKKCMDVPEVIEVAGFRASLQSDGKLTPDFRVNFERLLTLAKTYRSPTELRAAFRENQTMRQLHDALQNSYDKIVANSR